MKIIKINSDGPEREKIKEVIEALKKKGVIIFPTDTVYGMGADVKNEEAVNRVYQIKNRPKDKPLILFIEKKEEILKFVQKIFLSAQKLINDFWPGPLTLIFKASLSAPQSVVSKEGKVGIRLPAHKISCEVIRESQILLATTSANISGQPSSFKVEGISENLKKKVVI